MIVYLIYAGFGAVFYMVVHEIGYRQGVKDEKNRQESQKRYNSKR